jgi:hypothetical protein
MDDANDFKVSSEHNIDKKNILGNFGNIVRW